MTASTNTTPTHRARQEAKALALFPIALAVGVVLGCREAFKQVRAQSLPAALLVIAVVAATLVMPIRLAAPVYGATRESFGLV